MKNVDINKEKLERQARRKKKLLLRRIKTAGLLGAGALFLGIGLNACVNKEAPEKTFEFDQDSITNDDLANEYIDQLEDATGYELDSNNIALLLANFDIAYDNYVASVNQDKQLEQVLARIELVSATNKLVDASASIVDFRVTEALNIENGTATVKTFNRGEYDYIVVNVDGERMVYDHVHLPKEIKAVRNDIGALAEYSGTGENKVWDKAIDKYSRKALELYNDTVELLQQEYTYEDGKFKNANEKSK